MPILNDGLLYIVHGMRISLSSNCSLNIFHLRRFILSIVVFILDIRYWYTRRSTVSISILGTALISGSELYGKLETFFVKEKLKGFSIPRFIASLLLITSTSLVLPLLMIKAILHIEFHWWKGTSLFPIMQRGAATHRERASERLEATMSWYARVAVCIFHYRSAIGDSGSSFFSSSSQLPSFTTPSCLTKAMSFLLFYPTLFTVKADWQASPQ